MSGEHSHTETEREHVRAASRDATTGLPASTPPGIEDPGAQALSDALRSSFKVVKFLMVLLVAAFVASGVFTVNPNQVAIKLWFGKPLGVGPDQLLQPGLHWKLPYPVMDVIYIPVGETRTVTSSAGWYHLTQEEQAQDIKPQPTGVLRPGVDGYALTGDGNIIHARATLTYRIRDPIGYVFNFADSTNLLQHVLDNALFYAAARFSADDALYRNRAGYQEAVLDRVNETIDRLKLGITVEPREVLTVPPLDVETAFDGVVNAQQEGNIKIQQAEAYARGATNTAMGEAAAIIRDGITRSNSLVQTIAAEAKQFKDLLPRYRSDPELFKERLLADTRLRVLTNAQYKLFLPERADGKPWELRLQLSKDPEVPVKPTQKQ